MRYMFGDYTLDAERYTLHRGETPVRLEPRVFNLLAYLVQHPRRTVTKEELRAQLWPDQPFMSDDPLTNCVAQARKALGDSGQGQRYIKTIHGRGYCFIVPVDIQQPAMTEVRRLTNPDIRIAAEPHGLDQADTGLPSLTASPAPPAVLPPAQNTARTACAAAQNRPAAERRMLTVLVCRLVGLSASAAPLDLEVLLEVVGDYQEICAAVVHRFDGHIARAQSDRLLVYFGYPQAHEDDARRAVHTGLGLVAQMAELTRHLKYERDVRLAVRVGIHTGVMVIGAMGSGDQYQQLTLGDTPTIAARLHSLAEPDTVVISPATWRLVAGYFVCEALGAHVLDDLSEPLTVYRVLQKSTAQHRLDVATAKGVTPFVGREHEVGLLRERWQQATDGMGQVVLLSGEAGIGKSRLVQVLKEHLAGEPHTRIECCCSPYYQHSALYPVIEHLQRLLKLRREDTPQEQLRKLEDALQSYDLPLEEVVPLFAALLSLPPPASYPALPLTPQHQKQKTFDALLAWVLKEAERQPVCFIVEDLHWADPSTSEFLDRLLDHTPAARLLLVLLFRPDYWLPWPIRPRLTQIALDRLSHRQVECMVERMVGDIPLPEEVLEYIVAKTDGVPLFVEELTKMVLESGLVKEREGRYELVGPHPSLAIPDTLHDSLMARLDRLGSAKQVAQLGATIGREFSYELIQAVAPVEEVRLHRELGRLVEAELLYQRGLLPQARYLFKHALI